MAELHIPETLRAVGGIRAGCLCGWRSPATWPDTDTGLGECRRESCNHAARERTTGEVQMA